MTGRRLLAALGAAAASTASPLHGVWAIGAQQTQDPPSITVNGRATVDVEPDLARITLGVESEAPGAREAQAETSRLAGEVVAALEAAGVPRQAIRTSRLTLYPVYARPTTPQAEPSIRGYRAANTVTVELRDLATIGPVIDAAIGAGANRLEGVTFELRDPAEARATALAAAVADARSRAEAISSALGMELGAVIETTEGGVTAPPVPFAARGEALMVQEASTPVEPGLIQVTATLTVRYRLVDPGDGSGRG